jgi:hypothetical protein
MPCKHELDQAPRYIRWTCIFEAKYEHPNINPQFADTRCNSRYKHVPSGRCDPELRPYCYEE